VTPELLIDGRWQMFDPDIAIYYFQRDGQIANVPELAADPGLVESPQSPIFEPGENDWGYGSTVAAIYGTTSNNTIANIASTEEFHGSRITLPAGSRLIYPGVWTPAPVGYDGIVPSIISQFRQARVEIPAGVTGPIGVPWVLVDVLGTGNVRIDTSTFTGQTAQLRTFLTQPGKAVTEIEITANPDGMALIMLINPLWYDMLGSNTLVLTGKDVWAIQAATYSLPLANRPPPPVPDSLRKPRAIP